MQNPQIQEEKSIPKLIVKLSVPAVLTLLIQSAYSISDACFLSRSGGNAGGTVGIAFSLLCVLQTVGFTFGTGGGSLISKALGEGKNRQAESVGKIAFFCSVSFGAAFGSLGMLFREKLLFLLGAKPEFLEDALNYTRWILLASPLFCGSFTLSFLLRAKGWVWQSMKAPAIGNLLNILLDFFLIPKMGVPGASFATFLGQGCCFLLLTTDFFTDGEQKRKNRKKEDSATRPLKIKTFGSILKIGIPSFFRQGFSGISSVLLTKKALSFGTSVLSAVSVNTRIFYLLYGFCLGIGQGMMPAAGFAFGRKQPLRVWKLFRFSVILSSAVLLFFAVVAGVFAPFWISLFSEDAEIIRTGAELLRLQSAVLILHGTATCTNLLLQALQKPICSTVLVSARQGIFFLPLLFLLPRFGLHGFLWVQPLADILTFLFTVPFLFHIKKRLQSEPQSKPTTASS